MINSQKAPKKRPERPKSAQSAQKSARVPKKVPKSIKMINYFKENKNLVFKDKFYLLMLYFKLIMNQTILAYRYLFQSIYLTAAIFYS